VTNTSAENKAGSACDGVQEIAKRLQQTMEEVKNTVSTQLEDGKIQAERLLKSSRYAVEDGIGEVAYNVKREPIRFLAIAFGTGAALGLLVPHAIRLFTPRPSKA
jgi:hypothetical protein